MIKYQQLFSFFVISLIVSSLFAPFAWADETAIESQVESAPAEAVAEIVQETASEDMTFSAPELEQNIQTELVLETIEEIQEPVLGQETIEEPIIVEQEIVEEQPQEAPILVEIEQEIVENQFVTEVVEVLPVKETVEDNGLSNVLVQAVDSVVAQESVHPVESSGVNGVISGIVYIDVNDNGLIENVGQPEQGEEVPFTQGLTVFVEGTDNDYLGSYSTDLEGYYEFSNLPMGNFEVYISPTYPWVQTFPISSYQVELTEAEPGAYQKDFAIYHFAKVSGCVFIDLNGDGTWNQEQEPTMSGVTINLNGRRLSLPSGPANNISMSDVTDQAGCYEFADLPYGTFWVSAESFKGMELVYPNSNAPNSNHKHLFFAWSGRIENDFHFGLSEIVESSNSNKDSQELEVSGGKPQMPPANLEWCTIHEGRENEECHYKGAISGTKYVDRNGNGIIEEEDVPFEGGWTIYLQNNSTLEIIETTANENGFYEFTGLQNGDYTIWEAENENWYQTFPENETYSIEIVSEDQYSGNDFANFEYGKIAGCKFNDLNNNHHWDADEPTLPNWTIHLQAIQHGGTIDWTTVTGEDGCYEFPPVPAGLYKVFEEQQEGWIQTFPEHPTHHLRWIWSGREKMALHFGNNLIPSQTSNLSGCKFNDLNANAQWDDNEPTMAGWEINLIVSEELTISETTGENGCYVFQNIEPGFYMVYETHQDGWIQTFPDGDIYFVSTTPGEDISELDFGNYYMSPNPNPTEVDLGTAGNFVILAKSGISTTGTTLIVGDIGVSPIDSTAITGFDLTMDSSNQFSTSSLVIGKVYAADYAPPTPAKMTTAISDMETAYTDAAGRTNPDATELGAGDISGMTIAPGLYKWGTGLLINNGVTLDCQGNINGAFIFQIAQNLTVANDAIVTLSNGCQSKNIFWQVGGQATLGTESDFKGIILSQTLIEMQTGADLDGRALAQTAVTLQANSVTISTGPNPATISISNQTNSQIVSTSIIETDNVFQGGHSIRGFAIPLKPLVSHFEEINFSALNQESICRQTNSCNFA
ncbi:MAG: ice-binding family protein [archaeon]|nr:ice-binding family protein [archaeon]